MSDYIFEDLMRDITELDEPDDNDPRRISVHYDDLYKLIEKAWNTRSNWISVEEAIHGAIMELRLNIERSKKRGEPMTLMGVDERLVNLEIFLLNSLPSLPGESDE